MTQISVDEVKKLAGLAKISITDDEAHAFHGEIDAILGYVTKLNEVDTTGVEPTSQVTGLVNVTRADEILDYGVVGKGLLEGAPASKNGYIQVKKVL